MNSSIVIGRSAECVRVDEDFAKDVLSKHLSRIREYTAMPNLAESDVLVRGMRICNSARDYYFSRFTPESLREVADLLPGRPVQASHTYHNGVNGLPLGRFFAADVVKRSQRGWPEKDSHWVEALFYLPNDDEGQRIARRIDLGIYKEVSLGWRCADAECSVCDEDIRQCGHVPGEVYEGSGICDFRFGGITGVLEGSLVFSGGQKSTETFVPERSANVDGVAWNRLAELKTSNDFSFLNTAVRDELDIDTMLRSYRSVPGVRAKLFAVQCSRDRFESPRDASRWVRDHGFRADKMTAENEKYSFAQKRMPSGSYSMKHVHLDEGISGLMLKERERRDDGGDDSLETMLSKQ